MHIADNILKHHLRNVLFISGTAYGGKTTMSKLIETRYGITRYREGDHYDEHVTYADARHQPAMCYRRRNLYSFFNRPVEAYATWMRESLAEQAEMAVIDLIQLALDQRVVADVQIPLDVLRRIADPHQVILLVAPVDMVIEHYFDRDDKREVYDCIMAMKEPQKTLANVKAALRRAALPLEDYLASGLTCLVRDEHRSIEATFRLIEHHFNLTPTAR